MKSGDADITRRDDGIVMRTYEWVVVLAIYILDFLKTFLVVTANNINSRIKQTFSEKVCICLMTNVYIDELESVDEFLENAESGLVLDVHI